MYMTVVSIIEGLKNGLKLNPLVYNDLKMNRKRKIYGSL